MKNKTIANQLLNSLYRIENDEEFQVKISSIKTLFENLGLPSMIIEERVKGPISSLRKFNNNGNGKYQNKWNLIKDLYGLMIIVENNEEVDSVLKYIQDNFSIYKNPHVKDLISDYRKKSNRKEEELKTLYVYQNPTNKAYQTNDSYKTTKANLMIDEIPIEIQVKTKAQYIAHMATHDTAYKGDGRIDEQTRHMIADKMFPYFETFAYLRLNKHNMSQEEIEQTEKDIREIYSRNFEVYKNYSTIFNQARCMYGISFYLLLNREKFIKDSVFNKKNLDMQIAQAQVKQFYEYLYDKISKERPSKYTSQLVNLTIDKLIKTPYEEFIQARQKISGKYRHGSCVLTGIFDVLKPQHVKLLSELGDIYKEVHVGVIDDEISSAFLGHETVYNQQQRAKQIQSLKGVTSSVVVNENEAEIHADIEPLQFDEPEKKKYDMAYLSGIFDGFHPGHLEHLNKVKEETENIFVGLQTDEYSLRVKNKLPINSQYDRLCILNGIRGVDKVYLTETDMLPPKEFLDKAQQVIKKGGKVAIYLESDWTNKLKEKPKSSLKEIQYILRKYPEIILTSTKRENEKTLSSSTLREKLKESKTQENFPLEIQIIGKDYEL